MRSEESAVLEALVDHSQDQLAYLDRDFRFVRVNRAYCAGCRRRAEDLVGRNHFELFPNAENEAIFDRVRRTGKPAICREKAFVYADQPGRGVTYWDWGACGGRGRRGRGGRARPVAARRHRPGAGAARDRPQQERLASLRSSATCSRTP